MNIKLLYDLFMYDNGRLRWKESKGNRQAWSRAGYTDANGYVRVSIQGKKYMEHRLIWFWHYGVMPKELDHINQIKSDNRIENLREVTKQQNQWNTSVRSCSKSGIKNVHWNKKDQRWRVQLRVDGKPKYFGEYKDIDYAVFVADAMRHKYRGLHNAR
jgi:uncharacterized protein YqkB